MGLLKPSPGECADRLTILDLKVSAASRIGNMEACSAFRLENEEIAQYLIKQHPVLSGNNLDGAETKLFNDFYNLKAELAKVNARLWDLEDRVRDLLKDTFRNLHWQTNYVAIATQVPELNDVRARLVKEINLMLGDTTVEKLHPGV
jgi:hypothetical protein